MGSIRLKPIAHAARKFFGCQNFGKTTRWVRKRLHNYYADGASAKRKGGRYLVTFLGS